MIIKRITGGFTAEIRAKIVDDEGADLSTAAIKVLVLPDGAAVPARTDPAWKNPAATNYPADGEAILTVSVDEDDVDPGLHWLYVLTPTGQPFRADDDMIEFV